MRIEAATAEKYLDRVPPDRREALIMLRRIVLEEAPKANERLEHGRAIGKNRTGSTAGFICPSCQRLE